MNKPADSGFERRKSPELLANCRNLVDSIYCARPARQTDNQGHLRPDNDSSTDGWRGSWPAFPDRSLAILPHCCEERRAARGTQRPRRRELGLAVRCDVVKDRKNARQCVGHVGCPRFPPTASLVDSAIVMRIPGPANRRRAGHGNLMNVAPTLGGRHSIG